MGLFDYKNADGKALYSDAIALTLYAYTPTGQPLPATGWALDWITCRLQALRLPEAECTKCSGAPRE